MGLRKQGNVLTHKIKRDGVVQVQLNPAQKCHQASLLPVSLSSFPRVGAILSPLALTHLGREAGPAGLFLSSCSKYSRAHSHWTRLDHVPIPQPIPGAMGVGQADGRDLCHRLPSVAGELGGPKDGAWECLSGGTRSSYEGRGLERLSSLFPWPWASPLRPPRPWEKSNPFLQFFFCLVIVFSHFTNEQPNA